jgi:hypothetical protein
MATVIQSRPSQGQQNREAVGGALGNAIQGAWRGYTQNHDQSAIQNAVANLSPNASPREILDAVTNTRTYNPQAKQQAIVNYLGMVKQQEEARHAQDQENIARNRPVASKTAKSPEQAEQLNQALMSQGFSPEQVTQYMNAPAGVQGAINEEVKESRERAQKNEMPQPAIEKKDGLPDLPEPEGLTKAESVKWRNENRKHMIPDLKKYNEESRANDKVEREIKGLQETSRSNNLPSGLGTLVLNPNTGEPYALAQWLGLVNTDTQKWVKQVTDFIGNAKNFFGGRVTNFDVGVFKQRLPGLMNTKEGRESIMNMMLLNHQMGSLDAQVWKDGYHKYGDKADYPSISRAVQDDIERRREQMTARAEQMAKDSQALDTFGKDPKKYRNTTIMRRRNGELIAVPNAGVEAAEKRGATRWK